MNSSALTVRQAKFVDEYVVSGNAAAAARAAGYSERSAKQLGSRLTKVDLREVIAAKKQESAEKFELRREHVIGAILQAIAMAKAQSAPSVMIRGLTEIAKMLDFYNPATLKAEQRQLRPDGSKDVRFLPTADLLDMISADGQFRNPDGSAMNPGQIDAFYQTISTEALIALRDGRARVVTSIEIIDVTT
jgi:phage terminase small subunit